MHVSVWFLVFLQIVSDPEWRPDCILIIGTLYDATEKTTQRQRVKGPTVQEQLPFFNVCGYTMIWMTENLHRHTGMTTLIAGAKSLLVINGKESIQDSVARCGCVEHSETIMNQFQFASNM